MWPLASAFIDIALHRRGPEDLPASGFLVAVLFALYLLSGLLTLLAGVSAGRAAIVFFVVDAGAYLAFFWVVLRIFGRGARFPQTISAVLGTTIWLNVLALPLLAWHGALTSGEPAATLPLFAYLVLFVWSIDIGGYVLARALEQPYMVGVLIVILYVMASMSIGDALSVS